MTKKEYFSVIDYARMVEWEPRTRAYGEALKRHITPESVVMDIGAGTGFFSLLAAKLGAKRVIAIEPNDAIFLAKQNAKAQGLDQIIEFAQCLLSAYPDKIEADIIVSDLRGALPIHNFHIPIIRDARERFLKSGGVLLPRRDRIFAALISDPEAVSDYLSVSSSNMYDIDMSAGQVSALNLPSWFHPKPHSLSSSVVQAFELDYTSIKNSNFDEYIEFHNPDQGPHHGLILWFDAEIDEGLTYSNHPANPSPFYRSMFLPFLEPLIMNPQDRISIRLRANLVNGAYVWTWDTRVLNETDQVIVSQHQSTFYGGDVTRSER